MGIIVTSESCRGIYVDSRLIFLHSVYPGSNSVGRIRQINIGSYLSRISHIQIRIQLSIKSTHCFHLVFQRKLGRDGAISKETDVQLREQLIVALLFRVDCKGTQRYLIFNQFPIELAEGVTNTA